MLHDQPAWPRGGVKKRKIPWDARVAELADFRRTTGRFPHGYIDSESQLYGFVQYQRRQYRAGRLSESKKEYLDQHVPGWLTLPKAERERALWERRMRQLEGFVLEKDRYPRYKKTAEPLERTLAVWLVRQRHCLRTGTLENSRERRLNDRIPGWQR